jgi:hypothetical protein
VLLALVALLFVAQGQDFVSYTDYFAVLRTGSLDDIIEQRFEPIFALVTWPLAQLLSSDAAVVAVLAGMSIFGKWLALRQLSPARTAFLATGALYLARFAPLHEITQIRIALALTWWMLALVGVHRRWFWAALVLMPLSHYSTLLMVPLTLAWRQLQRDPARYARRETILWGSAFGASALLAITLKLLIGPLSAVFAILSVYSNRGFGDEPVHLLNAATLVDVVFLATTFCLPRPTPAQRFWLLTVALSLVVFVATEDFPVIAHRLYEMLSAAWIPYVACTAANRGWRGLHAKCFVAVCVPLYLYLYAFGSVPLLQL